MQPSFFVRHPRLATLLRLALAGCFTLALIEGGLRIAGVETLSARRAPPRDPADLHPVEFIADAQRKGWIPWPKTTKRIEPVPEHPRGFIDMVRNEASCREDAPTPLEKRPGVRRVLSLGDSHVDGTGFNDESFVNRLERLRSDVDGVNAGFGPSSPYQQLWAYEQVYRRFRPDDLVVVFYAGNDLLELLREDDRVHLREIDGRFEHSEPIAAPDVTRTTRLRWERFRQFFRDHSALYAALTDVPQLRRLVRGAVKDAYRERLETAMERHPAPVWQGLNQSYLFKHQPDRRADALRRLRHVLERFRDLTRDDEVRLTLLVLPTLRQVHPDVDSQGLAESIALLELAPDETQSDERACDEALALAAELEIDAVDLRTVFADALKADPNRPLYFQFDHHLNAQGQDVVARLLAERLFSDDRRSAAEPTDGASEGASNERSSEGRREAAD